jgi:hypothetical protein
VHDRIDAQENLREEKKPTPQNPRLPAIIPKHHLGMIIKYKIMNDFVAKAILGKD